MNKYLLLTAWIIVFLNLGINALYIVSNLQTYFQDSFHTGLLIGELVYYGSVLTVLIGLYQLIPDPEEE